MNIEDMNKIAMKSNVKASASESSHAMLRKVQEAQNLARMGFYTQAELILDEMTRTQGENALVLDLRAKIMAQQGRLAEAEKFWLRALSIDPGNPSYRKSLDYLSVRRGSSTLAVLKYIAIIMLAAGLIFFSLFLYSGPDHESFNEATLLKLGSIEQNIITLRYEIDDTVSALEHTYNQLSELEEQRFLNTENILIKEIETLRGRIRESQYFDEEPN